MAVIGFKCKKGNVNFSQCFSKCSPNDRCYTLPTLKAIANQRKWKGVPSVTQLLNGTRQSFLEISNEYFIKPESKAFALLGTKHHSVLEQFLDEKEDISEFSLMRHGICGTLDYYSRSERCLYDYKTYKLYGAEKARKGENKDLSLQMNMYRIMFEAKGFEVDQMKVQINIKDHSYPSLIYQKKYTNFKEPMVVLPVKILPDEEVLEYFRQKRDALHTALEVGYYKKCSKEETWGGMKCNFYCDVSEICQQMT